ncbi:GNAT family N-acetyltransferase [Candidatus Pacearchaeota archaeon]|nr:GNAT family N-acetyltransferase [Candidatus Pacearchaeota archaeon]
MIRRAIRLDLNRIYEIIHGNIKNAKDKLEIEKLYTKDKIYKYYKNYDIFIFQKNKKIIGCGRLQNNEIWMMYVDSKHHLMGIGTAIMKKLENLAKRRKINKIYLYPRETAIGFYKKLGYKLIKNKEEKMTKELK